MRLAAILGLGALASVASMTTAAADPYGAIIGGVAFLPRVNAEADLGGGCGPMPGSPCTPFSVGAGPGFRFGAAAGFAPDDDIAAEIEALMTFVRLRDYAVPPGGTPTPIGPTSRANVLTLMANLVVSMPGSGPLFYLGFGAGPATVGVNVPAGVFGNDELVDRDWAAAFQFFAGFNFETQGDMLVGLRYRLQHINGTTYNDGGGTPVHIHGFNIHGLELVLTFGR
jgi:opacity protein-like surface antigen